MPENAPIEPTIAKASHLLFVLFDEVGGGGGRGDGGDER